MLEPVVAIARSKVELRLVIQLEAAEDVEEAASAGPGSTFDVPTPILVAALLAVALLASGCFYLLKRRRRAISAEAETSTGAQPLSPTALLHESKKPELASTPVGTPPAYKGREHSTTSISSELEGTQTMLTSHVGYLPGISEPPDSKTPVGSGSAELEGSPGAVFELDAGPHSLEESNTRRIDSNESMVLYAAHKEAEQTEQAL